jgi:hypothetical protein
MDRKNILCVMALHDSNSLKTITEIHESLHCEGFNIKYMRLPIVDERAPTEVEFDILVSALKKEPPESAYIFNCQV